MLYSSNDSFLSENELVSILESRQTLRSAYKTLSVYEA